MTIDVVGTRRADDIHVRLSADLASVEVLHNGQTLGSYLLNTVALVRVDGGSGHRIAGAGSAGHRGHR